MMTQPTALIESLHHIEKSHYSHGSVLNNAAICHRLANRLGHEGHLEVAEMMLSHALNLDPEQGDYHADHGIMLLHLKRHREAGQAFARAMALGARHACVMNGMGSVLLHQGRHAKAAEMFTRSLSLRPDSLTALQGLAEALIGMERYAQAKDILGYALHLSPHHARIHSLLNDILMNEELAQEAETPRHTGHAHRLLEEAA
ncbi:MAG: tetratricopeptide repeat protein [Alphaproteobacteria bacterium]|nr:MAG: tetratricopeptide repeat protein [Alphaproteobacteria bacterium]